MCRVLALHCGFFYDRVMFLQLDLRKFSVRITCAFFTNFYYLLYLEYALDASWDMRRFVQPGRSHIPKFGIYWDIFTKFIGGSHLNCIALLWWIALVGLPQESLMPEHLPMTTSEPCMVAIIHLRSISMVDALANRARLRLLSNDFNDARADVDAALALDPTNPALYVLRGQVFLALYEWDLSLSDYNTAIQFDAAYEDAYFYRGVLHYSILQSGFSTHEDALADFEQYLLLAPEGPHAESAKQYANSIRRTQQSLEEPR